MRPLLVATSISMMAAGSVPNAAECDYRNNEIDLFTKEKLVTRDSVDMTSWISASFKQIIGNRHEMSVRAIGIGGAKLHFRGRQAERHDATHTE